jgi:hypothetical protein
MVVSINVVSRRNVFLESFLTKEHASVGRGGGKRALRKRTFGNVLQGLSHVGT